MWSPYLVVNTDESKIIVMIIAIMKTSFCFLENDQVLNPYSVTLWIGITEKIIKNGIFKKNFDEFFGESIKRHKLNEKKIIKLTNPYLLPLD